MTMDARFLKVTMLGLLAVVAGAAAMPACGFAEEPVFEKKSPRNPNDLIYGGRGVCSRSAIACVCSAIIPGVGQAINENQPKKIIVHGAVGLLSFIGFANPVGFVFGIFHIWSAWDALIDRPGGYINGTVSAPGVILDVSTREAVPAPAC
jgi:hypothetical protein